MIKVYGTFGPKCSDTETLYQMFCAGMTGMRLDLSHALFKDNIKPVENMLAAADRAGVKADFVIDMQGPELRTGTLNAPIFLREGDTAVFTAASAGFAGRRNACIPVPEIVIPWLKPDQQVQIDDGKIICRIVENNFGESLITGRILRGGILRNDRSLSLPGVDVRPATMAKSDLINIRDAKPYGITGIMQPFVRDEEDLKFLRSALEEEGCGHLRLLAKIENRVGIEHLEELLPYGDEFVVSRGDLGSDMELWELPAAQKKIASICRKAGKDFMVVTQMLTSMEHSPVPTRAEVCDIFNAVLDGAHSVMALTETATGEYPVEAMRYLANTAREALLYRERCEA